MRLFIAITPSKEMSKSLVDLLHDCKQKGIKGNYVPVANLHVTLCFIGEVQSAEPVKAAMDKVSAGSFKLGFDGMGNFGDLLYVGIKAGQKMKMYVKDICAALDEAGISYDKQKFVPHMTVIRKAAGNYKALTAPKGEMMVGKISLMKSETKNGKPVYTEIYSVKTK